MSEFLKAIIYNPETIAIVLLSILGLVLGTKAARRRRVALAAETAYYFVENLKADRLAEGRPSLPALDKISSGLQAANKWLVENKWRELTEAEAERVKILFNSIHGANKLADRRAQLTVIPGGATPSPQSARPL